MNAVRQLQGQGAASVARPSAGVRDARANLGVNGFHTLELDGGGFFAVLDRERTARLGDALAAVPDRHALALLQLLSPGIGPGDLQFLRTALSGFEEELRFEDRRPEPRSHKAVKIIPV